ncbi:hypothetical protein MTR67_023355 [Solanum verrucosum]|uniref:DUF4283 domain-containing protein n=1 Tax=Solanum verrucosum TaxID=315347 RepID=A0AAF0QZK2_SOLVR|nr:hypothetical protein MTR67_023355 [Solanum verrucosum]
MQAGLYTYHNKPFMLKNGEASFIFDTKCITTIPLWVNFPSLPVGYWSTEALSKVASAVGKPLYTDRYTIEMNRISYARVLVEVDISQPLVEIVTLDTPHGSFQQDVNYEWRPKFCSDCLKFGHDNVECWAKVSHDPPADDFKKEPRRKRRAWRKRRNI